MKSIITSQSETAIKKVAEGYVGAVTRFVTRARGEGGGGLRSARLGGGAGGREGEGGSALTSQPTSLGGEGGGRGKREDWPSEALLECKRLEELVEECNEELASYRRGDRGGGEEVGGRERGGLKVWTIGTLLLLIWDTPLWQGALVFLPLLLWSLWSHSHL